MDTVAHEVLGMNTNLAEPAPTVTDTVTSESDSKLTSECPPPPFYYKLFRTANLGVDGKEIFPPKLVDVDVSVAEEEAIGGGGVAARSGDALRCIALEKHLYGGSIFRLKRNRIYSPQTDYKSLLKENLKNVLTLALDLASNVPPPNASEVPVLALNNTLTDVHNILGEYRLHEGRENLISLRAAEIKDLQKLADDMELLLSKTIVDM